MCVGANGNSCIRVYMCVRVHVYVSVLVRTCVRVCVRVGVRYGTYVKNICARTENGRMYVGKNVYV